LHCPYHSWTYDLEGTLRAAPRMDRTQDFHCKQVRLPQLRCERWKGFIFVNFDADAIPLATLLEPLEEVVANYQLENMRGTEFKDYPSTWNWKVMVENVSEVYHGVIHRDILGRPLPVPEVSSADEPRNSVYSLHRILPSAVKRWPLAGNFDPIPGLTEKQLSEYLTVTLYPSTLIFIYPDQISLCQLLPQDMLRHTIRYVLCAPEKTRELPNFEKRFGANKALTDLIHGQDMDVCDRVQKGVNSDYAASYRFSHMEQGVWQFQNFILDKMLGETILPLG
jgi:phenylpropionate dioxygenase-like ring-hydroxylating dioxygenase large terminal subunit